MGVSAGCIAAVRKASNDRLSEADATDLIREMDRQKKALEARGDIDNLDARLAALAGQKAEATAIAAALQRRHAALSAIAFDRTVSDARARMAAGRTPTQALVDMLEGTVRNIEGGRASVAALKLAYEARYLGSLFARLQREAPHLLDHRAMRDTRLMDDVVREMVRPGSTKSRDARTLAAALGDTMETSRADLGCDIAGGAV